MKSVQPSHTAMMQACWRAEHAMLHEPSIYSDTRSVELVPEDIRALCKSRLSSFTHAALDAMRLLSVIRYRVLSDRLEPAHQRGIRQLVILGAGLDTTGFQLPSWAGSWRVFEVDHPATQGWKRTRIAEVGWQVPANLAFAPCDFESDNLMAALGSVGFERDHPTIVSWFGVILYLTTEGTIATLQDLATLAPESQVTLTYSEPPDLDDEVVREMWEKSRPIVDAVGESYVGYYSEAEMGGLVREAGFRYVDHHPLDQLNDRYLSGRSDGLSLKPIERLLTAVL